MPVNQTRIRPQSGGGKQPTSNPIGLAHRDPRNLPGRRRLPAPRERARRDRRDHGRHRKTPRGETSRAAPQTIFFDLLRPSCSVRSRLPPTVAKSPTPWLTQAKSLARSRFLKFTTASFPLPLPAAPGAECLERPGGARNAWESVPRPVRCSNAWGTFTDDADGEGKAGA